MPERTFKAIVKVLKESGGCNSNADVARKLGLHVVLVSTYQRNPPTKDSTWERLIRRFWLAAYRAGQNSGQKTTTAELLAAVRDIYGVRSQADIASTFKVSQPTVGNWQAGRTYPHKSKIQNLLQHRARLRVNNFTEMYPIEPCRRGAGWLIDGDTQVRAQWRDEMEGMKGIYVFYDSGGSVTYVGKTNTCMFTEVEQRLKAKLPSSRYHYYLEKGGGQGKHLVQGEVARMISVYEVLDPDAIHNLEALLLRVFPNDHLNKNLGKFK